MFIPPCHFCLSQLIISGGGGGYGGRDGGGGGYSGGGGRGGKLTISLSPHDSMLLC